MTNPEPILRTENVTMRFGGLTAVRDFSIDVPRGSIVGLIGPNGAGKTTVFNIVTGFYKPTEGKVLFDGQDITGIPPHMVCRAGISRTFQNIRLFASESCWRTSWSGATSEGRRNGGWRPWDFLSSAGRRRKSGKNP